MGKTKRTWWILIAPYNGEIVTELEDENKEFKIPDTIIAGVVLNVVSAASVCEHLKCPKIDCLIL